MGSGLRQATKSVPPTTHHLTSIGSVLSAPRVRERNSPSYLPLLSSTLKPSHLTHMKCVSWRLVFLFSFFNVSYNLMFVIVR